jgi:hypothetical protein
MITTRHATTKEEHDDVVKVVLHTRVPAIAATRSLMLFKFVADQRRNNSNNISIVSININFIMHPYY